MANMSYCRFENTLNDLRDCYRHLNDEDLSKAEEGARYNLVELCRQILEEWESYEE